MRIRDTQESNARIATGTYVFDYSIRVPIGGSISFRLVGEAIAGSEAVFPSLTTHTRCHPYDEPLAIHPSNLTPSLITTVQTVKFV